MAAAWRHSDAYALAAATITQHVYVNHSHCITNEVFVYDAVTTLTR